MNLQHGMEATLSLTFSIQVYFTERHTCGGGTNSVNQYVLAHLIGRGLLSIGCCCHRRTELWLAVSLGGAGLHWGHKNSRCTNQDIKVQPGQNLDRSGPETEGVISRYILRPPETKQRIKMCVSKKIMNAVM